MDEGKTVGCFQRLGPRSSFPPLLAQVQLEIHKAAETAAAAAETLSVGRNLAPSLPVPSHPAPTSLLLLRCCCPLASSRILHLPISLARHLHAEVRTLSMVAGLAASLVPRPRGVGRSPL